MVCLYLSSEVGFSGLHSMCIGLGLHMKGDQINVGYIKPLGYRYHQEEGKITDEDVSFMRRSLDLADDLDDLCPVVLTPQLVMEGLKDVPAGLMDRIKEAFHRISEGKDVVLAQGAYTSRQGSFLGLSAYEIASSLDARVVLVERFDDACLADNVLSAKDSFGPNLEGVIYNIIPSARESFLEEFLEPRLEKEGVPVLGKIPLDRTLRSINVGELARLLNGTVLCGEEYLDNMVEDIVVGAMGHEHALSIFRKKRNICVVTGGDRSDIMLAAMEARARCLLLTGNLHPPGIILGKAEEIGIPVILVSGDTFTTAENAEFIIRSARTHEKRKLERLKDIMDCCVDFARLYEIIGIDR
ncbi:MAG: phosphotransacetylase family protein [Actinomycetota bacterium]|nr:phosphotransacetylase family protein [Actinomycetota bacterium]